MIDPKANAYRQRRFKNRLRAKGLNACELWLDADTKSRLNELVDGLPGLRAEIYNYVLSIALDAFAIELEESSI